MNATTKSLPADPAFFGIVPPKNNRFTSNGYTPISEFRESLVWLREKVCRSMRDGIGIPGTITVAAYESRFCGLAK